MWSPYGVHELRDIWTGEVLRSYLRRSPSNASRCINYHGLATAQFVPIRVLSIYGSSNPIPSIFQCFSVPHHSVMSFLVKVHVSVWVFQHKPHSHLLLRCRKTTTKVAGHEQKKNRFCNSFLQFLCLLSSSIRIPPPQIHWKIKSERKNKTIDASCLGRRGIRSRFGAIRTYCFVRVRVHRTSPGRGENKDRTEFVLP